MLSNSGLSANSICSDAAGVAGNVFALVLFMSPIPTFRRIVRNRSTEQFSGSPYLYTLLNCLICLWYGLPLVSPGVIMIATVNAIGVVFQASYLIVFIAYASKAKKLKMLGLSISVLMLFLAVVFVSLQFPDLRSRQIFVGYLSVASIISMFVSPLFIIKLVIRTRSVEYMPFYLSFSTSLTSLSFLAYGLLKADPFIYFPNGIGTILGISQLALYFSYKSASTEQLREPLMNSSA
ncbi:bidirectional sugar transporter SWEET2a-like [Syzygium oleosum]|uniref:bidirectional sugar transporter SWEET2a-like n=1 Tax=Syzygium oleosum TaxID=219896 RepID=UPI0011D23192|nr:bidirectional sugar transporter SWEET2a-like [Syzygium oleosum]